ncbi:hypothetical protein N665_5862s0001 [Sinapis alba]|nr:hypothetical protein N665_5862s0001 [Sinapis alba]
MVENGVEPTLVTYSILVKGLIKAKRIGDACCVGKEMTEKSHHMFDSAVGFVGEMLMRNMSPGGGLLTTLIFGLCKHGKHSEAKEEVGEAFKIMDEMVEKGLKSDNYTYIILIRGLFDMKEVEEAIQFWGACKQNGMIPDLYTYSVMIDGCCKAERAEEGQKLFDEMMSKNVQLNTVVYNHLIGVYCKSGRLSMALDLREDMRNKGISPNCATYTFLIKGMSIITQHLLMGIANWV